MCKYFRCLSLSPTCTPHADAGSDVSSGEEEVSRKEEARLRATQRSRDLREKLKRKGHKKEKEGSASDAEPHPASDTEYVDMPVLVYAQYVKSISC